MTKKISSAVLILLIFIIFGVLYKQNFASFVENNGRGTMRTASKIPNDIFDGAAEQEEQPEEEKPPLPPPGPQLTEYKLIAQACKENDYGYFKRENPSNNLIDVQSLIYPGQITDGETTYKNLVYAAISNNDENMIICAYNNNYLLEMTDDMYDYAISENKLDIVEFLERKFYLSASKKYDPVREEFRNAIIAEDKNRLEELLTKYPFFLDTSITEKIWETVLSDGTPMTRLKDARRPVAFAVGQRKKDIAEFLINKGADFKEGGSLKPFRLAVQNADTEMIDFLLSKGVDINEDYSDEDRDMLTPLEIAMRFKDKSLARYLIERGAVFGNFNFYVALAVKREDLDALKILSEYGTPSNDIYCVDPPICDGYGYKHYFEDALNGANAEIISFLLEKNWDFNQNLNGEKQPDDKN